MPALPSGAVARGRARRERRALRTAGGAGAQRHGAGRTEGASPQAKRGLERPTPAPDRMQPEGRAGIGPRLAAWGAAMPHVLALTGIQRRTRREQAREGHEAVVAMGSSRDWRGLTAVRRWCAAAWSGRSENRTGRDMAARDIVPRRGVRLGNVGAFGRRAGFSCGSGSLMIRASSARGSTSRPEVTNRAFL